MHALLIVRRGVVKIPEDVSFEQAAFVEPVNTCLKGVESLRLAPGETVLVIGQGPIGIILASLARRVGARVIASDLYQQRLTMSEAYQIRDTIDASALDLVQEVRRRTEGEISLTDIEDFTDAVMVQNAMPYRKLFDGRGAFGKYDDHDMMMLAARVSAYAAVERRGALAIVPSPEYFEMASRFINLAKSGRPARVFLDPDEALLWLEAQPEA